MTRRPLSAIVGLAASVVLAVPATAAPRHHKTSHDRSLTQGRSVAHDRVADAGVSFDRSPRRGGYQTMVTDGPGTGYGFHRLPAPYRVGAAIQQDRSSRALREAVYDDAATNGGYGLGLGYADDSGYGYGFGNRPRGGVFNRADGYGSPYFAGYYGKGGGEDFGPFGTAYDD